MGPETAEPATDEPAAEANNQSWRGPSGSAGPVLSTLADPPADLSQLEAHAAEATAFLKKLANQDRLLIVCTLIGGEQSVSALEEMLGLRQPSLSQQLRELREAGLIRGRKDGKQMFYALADPKAEALVSTLHQLFCR